MSRGLEGRRAAWEVWISYNQTDLPFELVGFEHQCGALGRIFKTDLGTTSCPGCGFQITHPERECEPLFWPCSIQVRVADEG